MTEQLSCLERSLALLEAVRIAVVSVRCNAVVDEALQPIDYDEKIAAGRFHKVQDIRALGRIRTDDHRFYSSAALTAKLRARSDYERKKQWAWDELNILLDSGPRSVAVLYR